MTGSADFGLIDRAKEKTMEARFTVMAEDIKKGVRRDSNNCMIARTLKRYLSVSAWVNTHYWLILEGDGQRLAEIRLPNQVRELIGQFDKRCKLYPFSFRVEIPDDLARYFQQPCDRLIELKPQPAPEPAEALHA